MDTQILLDVALVILTALVATAAQGYWLKQKATAEERALKLLTKAISSVAHSRVDSDLVAAANAAKAARDAALADAKAKVAALV